MLIFKAIGHMGKDTLKKKNIDCFNDKETRKARVHFTYVRFHIYLDFTWLGRATTGDVGLQRVGIVKYR